MSVHINWPPFPDLLQLGMVHQKLLRNATARLRTDALPISLLAVSKCCKAKKCKLPGLYYPVFVKKCVTPISVHPLQWQFPN